MVKKKRQSDLGEDGDESTESCDDSVKPSCAHVGKAVDLTRLKKALKIGGFEKECSECKKIAKTEVSDPDFEEDLSLWMCLRCGSQLCGRARNQHALNHYQTPHSDCHALTTNTTTWELYCYSCNNEVTASCSKKLHECVEYLKKQANSAVVNKSLPPIELPPPIELIIKPDAFISKPKDKAMALKVQRVRGLSNLGNTCFFNSVMQCLVQTPYLLQVLQEMANPGEKFTLPGGKLKLKGEGDEEGKEVELPPITGELSEWGTLTRTLSETLADLQSGEGGVYTPRKLLSALVNKLPQFGGGDQHDAHELLRHLLEAVRSEDLRRYQSVILSNLGMNSKVDPSKVDEEVKQKVKFYGQQASDTKLRPEQVFRGFLVSTLECQECFHQSEREEHFLDLSLPVAASRPQPPAVVRRKTPNEENMYNAQEESKPSKHQLKKERIAAKKAARKNKGTSSSPSKEEAVEGSSSSSESDADVEDNADEPAPAPVHTAAILAAYLESGYNSEKVVSSDSFRTSPVDKDSSPELPNGPSLSSELTASELPIGPDLDPNGAELDPTGPDLKPIGPEPEPTVPGPVLPLELGGSNPDSGVASPAARADPAPPPASPAASPCRSPSAAEPAADLPPRPGSRISFFPDSGNEVVSRGISVRGSRSLLEPTERLEPGVERGRLEPGVERLRLDDDECSVRSCLASFTARELLTANNKVSCDTCTERLHGKGGRTVYTNATKRFLVRSAPPVLILHLKRFQLGPRCMFRKMSRHVEFPLRLDLGPYCSDNRRRVYSLYGVVEHSGGMHGGHYVAYVRAREPDRDSDLSGYESGDGSPPPRPARWYYVSDSCVSEVSEDKVLRAQAYLLFYERV